MCIMGISTDNNALAKKEEKWNGVKSPAGIGGSVAIYTHGILLDP